MNPSPKNPKTSPKRGGLADIQNQERVEAPKEGGTKPAAGPLEDAPTGVAKASDSTAQLLAAESRKPKTVRYKSLGFKGFGVWGFRV